MRITRKTFLVLSLLTATAYPLLSLGYGITWDEWMDSTNGMLTLKYLLSLGQDRSFMDFEHGFLYSQFFYTLTGTLYGVIFDSVRHMAEGALRADTHLLRFYTFSHVINAFFGVLGAVYTGLLARRLGGWRSGCLALVFIALSPRYLGNAMNNPKDIPFAAASVFSLYYLSGFLKQLPKPKLKTMLLLAAGIGMAIGTRSGGLLQIAYLFLFSALWWMNQQFVRKELSPSALTGIAGRVLATAVLGYALGLVFWPYGQLNPLVNPVSAVLEHSKTALWNGTVLFEGQIVGPLALPWYYIPKWIAISSPLYFLAGLALFALLLPKMIKGVSFWLWAPAAFAGIFPVVYVIVRHSMVLDSWRHFLFVYPPLVALSALAWHRLFEALQGRLPALLAKGLLAFLLFVPFQWMVRNHPHAYVYFNPLVGGVRGAFTHYETDYWGNCIREASEKLADYHKKDGKIPAALVRADGSLMSSYPFLKKELGNFYRPFGYPENFIEQEASFVKYAPYLKGSPMWNYAIVLSREWAPEVLRSEAWPPAGTVRQVKADGVTLCAVVENPNTTLKL